jgi:hypothetical protein
VWRAVVVHVSAFVVVPRHAFGGGRLVYVGAAAAHRRCPANVCLSGAMGRCSYWNAVAAVATTAAAAAHVAQHWLDAHHRCSLAHLSSRGVHSIGYGV